MIPSIQPAVTFFDPLLRFVLTWWGIAILAALDSSIVFALPFGIDAAMVVMGARRPALFWFYPIVATAGSLAGAASTYFVGRLVGEAGLARLVPKRRLARLKSRVRQSGALTLAMLDLLPPPFPFTPLVAAAGALEVSRTRFFATLLVVRLLRFGAESALGALYGAHIAAGIESRVVRNLAGAWILVAVLGAAISVVRILVRRRRTASGNSPQSRRHE
jgi:membrane protein YqaA with SNARE-associated domain